MNVSLNGIPTAPQIGNKYQRIQNPIPQPFLVVPRPLYLTKTQECERTWGKGNPEEIVVHE
jgi:hypothetical protein